MYEPRLLMTVVRSLFFLIPVGLILFCLSVIRKFNGKKIAAYFIIAGSCFAIIGGIMNLSILDIDLKNIFRLTLISLDTILPATFLFFASTLLSKEANTGTISREDI